MPTIHRLSNLVQRMLAAGEVIERPASVLRELIDNALDAQATHISVMLDQGGLGSIAVHDNGAGMEKTDLRMACKAHYTSKLASVHDFNTLASLGFRGEALSSISSVSKTLIQSGVSDKEQSHSITVQEGTIVKEDPAPPLQGTVVTVTELFHSLPARRKFLRRAQVEHQHCKHIFLDKACAYPQIHFTLYSNGKQLINLTPSSPIKRLAHSIGKSESAFFATQMKDTWFQADILASFPTLCRKDRSQIHIFVNKRRVKYFGLLQAIEYAARSLIPGGLFPYARVFLNIDPGMVDVNVHPAKSEVKIQNIQYLHHQLTSTLRRAYEARIHLPQAQSTSFETELKLDPLNKTQPNPARSSLHTIPSDLPVTHHKQALPAPKKQKEITASYKGHKQKQDLHTAEPSGTYTQDTGQYTGTSGNHFGHTEYGKGTLKRPVYLMQLYKKYLVCLIDGQLTIVDQHAAHERILYNTFRSNQDRQALSVPLEIPVHEEDHAYIASIREELSQLGISIDERSGKWFLVSLPVMLVRFAEALREKLPKESLQHYLTGLYAQLACKRAVKAGDIIAPQQAQSLLDAIVHSKDERCPHGRPLLLSLSEDVLDKKLGRCPTTELMHT